MLGRILSSIGIGGATVDTVLENPDVVVGDTLRGEVRVRGGSAEQDIRAVALELVTRAIVEGRDGEDRHAEIALAAATVPLGSVGAGEERAFPVAIAVPAWAPLSVGSTRTTLRTRLDVAGAIDPRDSDAVRILPDAAMRAVFAGLEDAGFRLVETEVEHRPGRAVPFAQEFDFRPMRRGDWGIEEVEIAFSPAPGGVEVLLTVDNRGGFFSGARERSARFRVMEADLRSIDMGRELRRAVSSLRR